MNPDWNERYQYPEFAYGKAPNEFFAEWLQKFEPGSILMPADGEGRNGVFAAHNGWEVTSFDLSIEGQKKALQLATEHNVTIAYEVGDFEQLDYRPLSFDAIGMIYAHFAANKKSAFHKKLIEYLKPGGVVIFEAFGKNHLEFRKRDRKVGGPMDLDMLYSTEELSKDFTNFQFLLLEEKEIQLNEGNFHNGKSSVVQFVGRKNAS